MKQLIHILNIAGCAAMLLFAPSCNGDIDFGEQYKKTIYLVHGQDLLYSKEHAYGTANDRLVFSVYCASSEPIGEDVSVVLRLDPHALDSLNARGLLENAAYIDKQILPASSYEFTGQANVTIRAGQQYATLEVPFNPEGLNPGIAYTLPLSIVSNNKGYELIPASRSLVYEVKMVNRYSGSFVGTSAQSPTVVRPVQPALKAMSLNQVRMPIHDMDASVQYLDTRFMILTVAEDGQVSIAPWANAKVVDMGGNFFDEVQQSYELHYRYTGDNGDMFTVTEKIANIDAPKLVQK